MDFVWTKLPLYDDLDYEYSVSLEGNSYTLRLQYSTRTQTWSYSLSTEDGDSLILGEALLPNTITYYQRNKSLSGFFWLEPIALDINQTPINPSLLYKYYNLYYIQFLE